MWHTYVYLNAMYAHMVGRSRETLTSTTEALITTDPRRELLTYKCFPDTAGCQTNAKYVHVPYTPLRGVCVLKNCLVKQQHMYVCV